MPLYQFSISDGDHFEDLEGVDLSDDKTARAHAIRVVHELQKDDEAAWCEYTLEVKRDGQLVWEIPFEVSRPAW